MMRDLRLWLVIVVVLAATWWLLLAQSGIGLADIMTSWWPAAVTMVGGAFISGASAEGGGAVAYPVFTLLLKIPPDAARNFSFMIQSVGMVSASALIIGRRIPIDGRVVVFPAIGGMVGLLVGTYTIVPLMEPVVTKLFFVSAWLAFGIGLWRLNRDPNRTVVDRLPDVLTRSDVSQLIITGLVGGLITSVVGNGIDIFTFCVVTLRYGLSEKVATPSSVVLMSILTLCGSALHGAVMADIGLIETQAWLAAAPVVLFMAPFGAWVASKLHRLHIALLLQAIIVVQFLGALYVLRPSIELLLFCVGVVAIGVMTIIRIDRSSR